MNKHHFLFAALVGVAFSLHATAGHIDEAEARIAANRFIHHHRTSTGMFKAANASSLSLAHVESSATVANANDYYAFNVAGGGWVLISGEERAVRVLGYSDRGYLDFEHLPCNFKALVDGYKHEIECLRSQSSEWTQSQASASAPAAIVAPFIKSSWGQDKPFNLQCPIYQNEHCRTGCVAVAMSQVMRYWQYPQSCGSVASYFCSKISRTLSTLPPTTFDYNMMPNNYSHWDWDKSELVQDHYTNEQAQEVAKLMRYCGQAVKMAYNPESSGAQVTNQLRAMKDFGYTSTKHVTHDYLGVPTYSNQTWESMMREELDAGRPILYSALDLGAGAHAFICDGYDNEGMFHFNMGWYGTCDGWYVVSALKMNHYTGLSLHFSINHEMLIGIEPPAGWEPPTQSPVGDIDGSGHADVVDLNILVNLILDHDVKLSSGAQADLNGDNSVDIADVSLLVDIILKHTS